MISARCLLKNNSNIVKDHVESFEKEGAKILTGGKSKRFIFRADSDFRRNKFDAGDAGRNFRSDVADCDF